MTPSARTFFAAALCLAAPFALGAQARRLELADTARNAPRNGATNDARSDDRATPVAKPDAAPPHRAATAGGRSESAARSVNFQRDQTVLSAVLYAPAFALSVTKGGVPAIATYLVVATGGYFASADYTRHHAITATESDFATGGALRGALAGWAIAQSSHADSHGTAGGIFIGSFAGMASGLVAGGRMTDGEAAATRFGGDLAALIGYGFGGAGTSAHASRDGGLAAVGAAIAGLPLGYWYAHQASYRVTGGDVAALWTSAGIGAAAAGTFVANGSPSKATVASALAGGALVGAFAGDRFLVRSYDHSLEEGQVVALGATAGGVMGAGIGLLTAASHERVSGVTVGFGALGATAGLVLAERYLVPRADAGRALGRLELNPAGVLAAASRQPGAYPMVRWTF
ncbi:MAG: hypothetical protein HYR75_04635 [Gemmatimonadetes bacterium]|nr:hypothetical protein [Gemmatimonadota bacterium]MBI3569120.1 hypothetical protein [Gemmatimonadota bacterium]